MTPTQFAVLATALVLTNAGWLAYTLADGWYARRLERERMRVRAARKVLARRRRGEAQVCRRPCLKLVY